MYHDFIAFAPTSSMPWDFTKRVIAFYNKIPNKKYPITINPEKVQNMLFYGVMHEYARCVKPEDNKKNIDIVNIMVKTLELITGINFDKKIVFENAIKKVSKTNNYNIKNLNRDI